MKEYKKNDYKRREVFIIMWVNDRYEESEKIIKNKERGFIMIQMDQIWRMYEIEVSLTNWNIIDKLLI